MSDIKDDVNTASGATDVDGALVLPQFSQRPFIAEDPRGGALVVWSEPAGDGQSAVYGARIGQDGDVSAPVCLITSANLPGDTTYLFAPPTVRQDGSFTLLVSHQAETDDVLAIDFDASLEQLGAVRTQDGVLPRYRSGSFWDTAATLDSGTLVIADPDGELRAVDEFGVQIASLNGLGDLRFAEVMAVGAQRFALLLGSNATYYEIIADQIVETGTTPLGEGSFRNSVALQLDGQVISVLSTRDLKDVSELSDNVDTIVVQSIAPDGTLRILDQITNSEWPLSFTDAIVALPDGGFAIAIHHGPYGVGGEFAIRRYNNDGTFLSERIAGEGQGSSNNGGYDHQLTALDDGTLILSYQTATPDGQRAGGHIIEVLDPDPPISALVRDQSDVLRSSGGQDERPMIVAHPDGGILVAWTQTTWHLEERSYKGSLHLTRFDADGNVVADNAVLLSDVPTSLSGYEFLIPPQVDDTGLLDFVIFNANSGAMRYQFDPDLQQTGAPIAVNAAQPFNSKDYGNFDEIQVANGDWAYVDRGRGIQIIAADGDGIARFTTPPGFRVDDIAPDPNGGLWLTSKSGPDVQVQFIEKTKDGYAFSDLSHRHTIENTYRSIEIAPVAGGYVLVASVRTQTPDENGTLERADTIDVFFVAAGTGEAVRVDHIPSTSITLSEGVVGTPDGGFVVAQSEWASPNTLMHVRTYNPSLELVDLTTFLVEQHNGHGNGGYEFQLNALSDGRVVLSWPTFDGAAAHDVVVWTPAMFGTINDDALVGTNGADELIGLAGNDTILGNGGTDLIDGGTDADVIMLSGTSYHTARYVAFNVSSENQVGTQTRISLEGLERIEAVTDGGAASDIVQLSEEGDAFFLHDAYSGFHNSVTLTEDYIGNESAARLANIEEIRGMGGDDIIDLTSPDYSLAGVAMSIEGGEGNDVIWGSDADEAIFGGAGNDTMFGGIGKDVLTGGAGADVFEFTRTSTDVAVTDFNILEGDTLRFYNAGGAVFDASSIALTDRGILIFYTDTASGTSHELSIDLNQNPDDFDATLPEVLGALDFI